MTPEAAYRSVWSMARETIDVHIPDLRAFLPTLPVHPDFAATEPQPIAANADLEAFRSPAPAKFQPLIKALITAAPSLRWLQSYSEADSVTPEFLKDYGYISLSGPDGPLIDPHHRLFIAFWGRGLWYPEHHHLPAEVYAILAGEAVFHAGGRDPRRVGPGDCVHHAPSQLHATDMTPGPLLALIGWVAEDLAITPKIVKPAETG